MAKKNKSAKAQKAPKKIVNRRASYDYELNDDLVVGIQLTGAETKALRRGHGQLRGAYVTVKDDEIWLLGAQINGGAGIFIAEDQVARTRKLLAKRRQIDELIAAKKQGRTIVPVELLTGGRFIKLRIAAGRGRRNYDKRQALAAKDAARQAGALAKNRSFLV